MPILYYMTLTKLLFMRKNIKSCPLDFFQGVCYEWSKMRKKHF